MITLRWMMAALLALGLLGCGLGKKKDSEKIVEGESISKSPLGVLRQLGKAGEDLKNIQKDLENMKPAEPVHFSELLKFLPEPPAGWESQAPRGSTNKMGEWSFTQVERQYTQGDKHFDIQIVDWAFRRELYAPFLITSGFSQEDTEGYNKGIKIGDEPGREEYKIAGKNGTLSLLVGKRFFVTIKGRYIEAADLRQWLDRVDTKALRAKAG